MYISTIATAVPENRYTQAEICDILYGDKSPDARRLFEKAAIATRHSVMGNPEFILSKPSTQQRNALYVTEARKLAAEAARRCLDTHGLAPTDVDTLVVVSCTGYEIPGLDLALAHDLGMRPDLKRTCVLGMGCYAAFPGLQRALDAVGARPGTRALVVAVELCTIHLQPDDTEDNLVSTALFADGAAAVLVEPQGGLRVVDSETRTQYDTAEHMSFQMTDHGFKMYLSSYVPQILATNLEPLLRSLLTRNGISPRKIRFWAVHPGGRKIVDYLQAGLGLSDEQVASSRRVLRDYGNMSSPTVLFVLEDIMRTGNPQPGDYAMMMAFGPGLTLESALLRWE